MNDTLYHNTSALLDRSAPKPGQERSRRLLAVGMDGPEHSQLISYAQELGARIGCDVVTLTIVQSSLPQTGAHVISQVPAAAQKKKPSASRRPADAIKHFLEYRARVGDLSAAISELTRTLKGIDVILTNSDSIKETLSETELTPVFRIMEATLQSGGTNMSSVPMAHQGKPIGKTLLLGALTAALYAAVFWNADLIMKLFTRGGLYAALPIATAFTFSFAHGAFASNLWSLLGIHAKPTTEAYKSVSANAQPTKAKTTRPRARAYVNPFYNIDLKSK